MNSQHTKPKKANTKVVAKDYVCTTEDFAVVESIMSAPTNTKFVDIGDAELSNDNLKCLTRDDGFLPDDVFLPINISKTHWYLAVINAKKRLIQVLDSLGPGMGRSDLTLVLQGLEKHLNLASQRKGFEIGEKWHDLNVTTWSVEEHIQKPLETDGASCGLFMLNFMEYWTGDVLSDYITQEDMKAFRRKLVAILHDSELNKIRGRPIYDQSQGQENGSDSDITELLSLEGKHPHDVAKENRSIPLCTMSTKPHELIDEICKYIKSIDDATCLEKEWVRSSKPYPLSLTLKQIQDILRMDQPMDKDCFNMAVSIVACDEIQFLIEPPVHNMDLSFCVSYYDHIPDIKELATLFHSWPGIDNNISSCNMIYLPHTFLGDYILFTIDKHEHRVSILDLFSKPLSDERYQLKLQRCSFYLNNALEIAQPGWNSDIYFWPRKYPHNITIPTSPDRKLSGYLVFSFMLSWDGKRFVHPVCTDGYELRKKFLIHILKYLANEVEDNIPEVVRGYLTRIKGPWL
ncbi:hypothetical protein ACQ4PT_030188 [Festuca glaucescens]